MQQLINELAQFRKEVEQVKSKKKALLEAVTESKEYKDLELSS